jgi:ribosomal protein S18 acetylase RimI-like enzyme
VGTHPDHQGRGHARRLVLKLVRRQLLVRGLRATNRRNESAQLI